jgi:HSP20 family protein
MVAATAFLSNKRVYCHVKLVEYAAKELCREIGRRTRDFYELVMPAVDMYEDEAGLVIKIDLPGFTRDEISIRIDEDILSINARKEEADDTTVKQRRQGAVFYEQRPLQINKRILLPSSYSIKKEEKVMAVAAYSEGVVTLRIPITGVGSNIPIT